MRDLRIITLILFILTGVVKSVKADDDSGNNAIAGVSLIGVSVLLVYDILSAPASAERYNKSLTSMLPVIKESRYASSTNALFGQAKFSKAALIKGHSQPIAYAFKQSPKHQKSSGTAFLLSLGATIVPAVAGLKIMQEGEKGDTAGLLLIISGATLGPSLGHFYAKQRSRGLITALIRGGLVFLAISTIEACFWWRDSNCA